MRSHYDFSNGVLGKYVQRVKGVVRIVRVVTLDPDVASVFLDARSVNRALRRLIAVRRQRRRKATRESSRRKATLSSSRRKATRSSSRLKATR
jgi:hypothetical protein